MKKKLILFFAMLATMVVLAVGFTIGTSATTYTVTTASDFTSKISSAAAGDTIDVTANISVSTKSDITKNLTITSSNGSTVTVGVTRLLNVKSGSTLTINGSIKFVATGTYENIVNMCNGTAYIKGNSEITAYCTPLLLMHNSECMTANCTLYIQENAKVTVTATDAVKNMFYMTSESGSVRGTVNVQGGTLSNPNGFIFEIASGNVNISGGTINADYPFKLFYGNGNATKNINISGGTLNAGVSCIHYWGNCRRAKVTISGGTLNGGHRAINCADLTGNDYNEIIITGGTLEAPDSGKHAIALNGSTLTVSGGTIYGATGGINFTGSVAKTLTVQTGAYIYGGTYGITTDGSNYTLNIKGGTIWGGTADIKDGTTVSSRTGGCVGIGGTYYSSLKSAVAAASAGNTITIYEDTVIPAALTINKALTLTPNDNVSIDVRANSTISQSLTIVGSNTLTLTSSSAVTVTATVDNAFSVGSDASHSGKLTIEGSITVSYTGGTIVRMVNGTLTVQGNAVLTSTGGTTVRMATDGGLVATSHVYVKGSGQIKTTSSAVDDNAIYVNGAGSANLHVQGGTVSNANNKGYGVSLPGGTVEITSGTISGRLGLYVWYGSTKTITVSGGTVQGTEDGIYMHTNTKACTLNISSGTVKATGSGRYAIRYQSTQASSGNAINISGGTVTSLANAMYFTGNSAITVTVTGGTISTTSGNNAIYGKDMTGNLTLNVSGSSTQITAKANNAIIVTSSNTTDYPGKLVATISNGTVKAETACAIDLQHGSVTLSGGTITAPYDTIYATNASGSFTMTGGSVTATGSSKNAINLQGGTFTIQGGSVTGTGNGILLSGSTTKVLNVNNNDGGGYATITGTAGYGIANSSASNYTVNILMGTITGGTGECQATISTQHVKVTGTHTWYPTVAAAIAAVDGGTITVVGNTTETSKTTITKTITLTSTGAYTVSSSVAKLFDVGSNSTTSGNLTINGSLTVSTTDVIAVRIVNGSATIGGSASVSSAGYTLCIGTDDGLVKSSSLTVSTSGTISATNESASAIWIMGTASVVPTVSVSNGTIQGDADCYGIRMRSGTLTVSGSANISGASGIRLENTGSVAKTVNIQGGTVAGLSSGRGIDATTLGSEAVAINITGGTISSSSGYAIAIGSDTSTTSTAQLSASGVTLTGGAAGGIYANNASVTITSGSYSAPTNTLYLTGSATANVSGSTTSITATTSRAIYSTDGTGTVTISNGTISAPINTIYYEGTGQKTLAISGGTIRATQASSGTNSETISCRLTANSSVTGYALDNGKSNHLQINMTGGTVTSNGVRTIYGRDDGTFDMSISAGTVSGYCKVIHIGGKYDSLTVSGAANITASSYGAVCFEQSTAIAAKLTMTGGSITAPGQAIMTANVITPTVNISGGTVSGTTSQAIAVHHGSVSISSAANITAPTQAIYVNGDTSTTILGGTITASGDFCIETNGGTVNITGGTLTAGGYGAYLRGAFAWTVTGGKMTAGENAVFAVSTTSSSSLTISNGVFVLKGSTSGRMVADASGSSSNCTVTVNGGLFVQTNSGSGTQIIADFTTGSGNTVNFNSARVLYKSNLTKITNSISSPGDRSIYAVYDINGNGSADSGETFYLYVKCAASSNTYSGEMTSGASVRYGTKTGIRFITEYSSSVVSALNAKGTVTYGTLIVPSNYLLKLSAFTKAELDSKGITYANVVANEGKVSKNGGYTIRAALVDLKSSHFGTSFSAISYALVGGTYYYTAFNTVDNSRSMSDVAQAALNDLSATQTGEYKYAVSTAGGTKYSPYAAGDRTTLGGYVVAHSDPNYAKRSAEDYRYSNNAATYADYEAMKSELLRSGYVLPEETTVEGNVFAIFTGNGKVLTLSYSPGDTTLCFIMKSADETAVPAFAAATADGIA